MIKMKKIVLIILLFTHIIIKLHAQPRIDNIYPFFFKKGILSVSEDGEYLLKNNKPFLYSAFTMWNFLYNYDLDQSLRLIEIVKNKGFNIFQISILPNERSFKRYPFIDGNLMKPDTIFFQYLDSIIKFSLDKDLFIAISLYWNTGDKIIENKFINNKLSITHAFKYAQWIAQRYLNYPNIIWIVGGNAIVNEETYPIWEAMGSGIRSVDKNHLITFFENVEKPSSNYNTSSWLDFYSLNIKDLNFDYHQLESLIQETKKQKPTKPVIVLNMPCVFDSVYEVDEKTNKLKQKNLGKYLLWSFLLGTHSININVCNKTDIFDFLVNDHLIDSLLSLIKSRPWYTKVYNRSYIKNFNINTENKQIAIRGDGFFMVYLPEGGTVEINFNKIGLSNNKKAIYWYKLLEGKIVKIDTINEKKLKDIKFIAPSSGCNNDYILLIDDLRKNFSFPGTKEYEPIILEREKWRKKPEQDKKTYSNT